MCPNGGPVYRRPNVPVLLRAGKALRRPSARARAFWVRSLAKKRRRRLLLDVQSRSVDKLPDIIAQGKETAILLVSRAESLSEWRAR